MSTFVLKKGYELELPINYSEVDSEEMNYIDGGGSWDLLLSPLVQASFDFLVKNFGIAKAVGIWGFGTAALAVGYYAGKYEMALMNKNRSAYSYYNMEKDKHRYCCQGMRNH